MVGLRDTIRSRIANTADKSIDQLADLGDSRLGKIVIILAASGLLSLALRTNSPAEEKGYKICQITYSQKVCSNSSCSINKADYSLHPGDQDLGQLFNNYGQGKIQGLNVYCR